MNTLGRARQDQDSGSYGNKNGYVVRVLDQRLSNSLHESLVTLKCLLKCPMIVIVRGVSTFSAPLLVELVHVGEILEDVGRVGDRMRAGGCVVERARAAARRGPLFHHAALWGAGVPICGAGSNSSLTETRPE